MSLSNYCNAIQEEQAKTIRNKDIEIEKLSYELQKQNETIEQLRKTNSQLLEDYESMRNRYFNLQEQVQNIVI